MKKTIFFVGGTKGGVGKSTISIFLIDYFLENNKSIALCETDNGNPDVYNIKFENIIFDGQNCTNKAGLFAKCRSFV